MSVCSSRTWPQRTLFTVHGLLMCLLCKAAVIDFDDISAGLIGDQYLAKGVRFFAGNGSQGSSSGPSSVSASAGSFGTSVSAPNVMVPAAGSNADIWVFFYDTLGVRKTVSYLEVKNDAQGHPRAILQAYDQLGTLLYQSQPLMSSQRAIAIEPGIWFARIIGMPGDTDLLGVDDFGFAPDNGPRLSGNAQLGGFVGSTVGGLLSVQIWQNSALVESLDGNYGPDWSFSISPAVSGPVIVKFRYRTGLWKAVAVNLGPTPIENVNVTMTNGDCDGDNEIGIGDYSILSSAYASSAGDGNWSENADLNGDQTVDIADYAILSANYGEVGD